MGSNICKRISRPIVPPIFLPHFMATMCVLGLVKGILQQNNKPATQAV